jgi:hypothetical protein
MSEIVRRTFETPAVRVIEVEAVDVGGDLFVYRVVNGIYDIGTGGVRSEADATVDQGVVDIENLQRMEENLPFEVYQPYQVPEKVGTMYPVLVTPKGLDIMRHEGSFFHDNVRKKLEAANMLFVPSGGLDLVQVASRGINYEDILFISSYDHVAVDVRGKPVPAAMYFTYLDGGFSSDEYDLEAVAEVLAANPEIEFITQDRWEKPAPITKIPYYNASDERDRQVQFIWRPSDDTWNEILGRLGFDPADPRHMRIRQETITRELDIFGVEKFKLDARGLENG